MTQPAEAGVQRPGEETQSEEASRERLECGPKRAETASARTRSKMPPQEEAKRWRGARAPPGRRQVERGELLDKKPYHQCNPKMIPEQIKKYWQRQYHCC